MANFNFISVLTPTCKISNSLLIIVVIDFLGHPNNFGLIFSCVRTKKDSAQLIQY